MLDPTTLPHDAATLQALAQLERLTAIGMEAAERLSDIMPAADNRDAVAIANAIVRVAKAVRMTIMLRARLACEGLAGAAAADAARRDALAARHAATAALEPQLEEHPEREERFDFGLGCERGDRPERFDDLTVDEALVQIAKGLGLKDPIDLTADPAEVAMPALDAIFARAGRRAQKSAGAQNPQRAAKAPAIPP